MNFHAPTSPRGQYMHTSTGAKYFPFDPREEDVNVEFIAHHLACQGRWNGATQHRLHKDRIIFTVAEHSVLVSLYVEVEMKRPDLALEALMHDAPEGPLGDVIRPIKYSAGIREPYKKIEVANEKVIFRALNLVWPIPHEVKVADEAVCTAESNQIVPKIEGEDWTDLMLDSTNEAPYEIQMLQPYQAKQLFLGRFKQLAAVRHKYRSIPSRFLL